MTLDVGRLRVLVEVARAGSIAEAARRMAYTPSAVSQQLAKLETELQTRLVERTGSGVRLTEVGAVLLRHAERVLGELREAEAAARAAIGATQHRIALGTFATAGTALVPTVLAELRLRHPETHLTLLDLEPPDGYALVTSGDLDLLITHRYPGVPAVPTQGLTRSPLLADPLRLVLPATHPLSAHSGPIPLAALRDDHWISGTPGVPNRVCLTTLTTAAGFTPQVSYETRDYALTLALIRAGLGISLIPSLILPTPTDLTVHSLADASPTRRISLIHRSRPTPLTTELITLLRSTARTL
ncbi:molybdate transport repressor ModE-like protein [Actinocorallia herbida]|uniref:Molybdate transport repressor ModE-like protein n=1 Tax=Actinocorallia herbida TaxID=58109 RepID=A0A3N1CVR8_9ACTN|nr:LysR family transcriptional regulator [Actinocorallia herbida]ROO85366.1 molybdate transport repressor ModE-like protein [Actinocorallia herbida]